MTATVLQLPLSGSEPGVDPNLVQRRRRPVHILLGTLIVLFVVGVEIFLVQAYRETSETTRGFDAASTVTTFLANVQREAIMLQAEVERLDRTGDIDAVALRRMILARQMSVARSYGDREVNASLSVAGTSLIEFDRVFASLPEEPTHTELKRIGGALARPLRTLEATVKDLYDRVDIAFNGIMLETLQARARNQRVLLAMGPIVMILGAGLALSLRSRVRKDFERAYVALRKEFNERRAAEETLRSSEERFRSMIQNSSDIVTIVDENGIITYQTPSAQRVLGMDPAVNLRRPLWGLVHPADRAQVVTFLEEWRGKPGITEAAEWRMQHGDGTWRHCQAIGTNLLDDPNVCGMVLNMRDVTERRALEDMLSHRAFHDPLTELANRAMFHDRVEHALARGQRTHDELSILFIDLDDFKRVNDSMGHAAGDELLLAVAGRIMGCIRPADTAARLGGDEFAILLESSGEAEAIAVAERILQALDAPVVLQGRHVFARGSIGIVVGAGGQHSAGDLLRDADAAMYSVKAGRKGHYEVFRPHLHAAALARLELEADLKAAIDANEFMIQLQPIIRLDTSEAIAFEALARWAHPTRGILQPSEFIEAAEATGLIVPIGRQVLALAAQALVQAEILHPEFQGLPVSVNLSAKQLQDPRLIDDIEDVLRDSGLAPGSLVLEITESILMDKLDVSAARIAELKLLGISVAIDDFGSGYSSLSYLNELPIDILKIDKSFVTGIGRAFGDAAFMRALHDLAKTLELTAVVEGVETEEQLAALKEIGFEMAQGFLFAEPMALEDLVRNAQGRTFPARTTAVPRSA